MYKITEWTAGITDDKMGRCMPATEEEEQAMPHRFRLLDDDGIIYAYGISDDDSSFDPLDDYEGIYGVTRIEYYDNETSTWILL